MASVLVQEGGRQSADVHRGPGPVDDGGDHLVAHGVQEGRGLVQARVRWPG